MPRNNNSRRPKKPRTSTEKLDLEALLRITDDKVAFEAKKSGKSKKRKNRTDSSSSDEDEE